MKQLLSLFAILMVYTATAQNYNCIQPGKKKYFLNSYGYVRGIKTDTAYTSPDSVVCHLFRTPRGLYPYGTDSTYSLDPDGASWLGKRTVQYANGTFMTNNIWGDTVIIHTQANIGDTWIFYNDGSQRKYVAEMIGIGYISLGTPDTIKRILISAYDDSGIVYSDPCNFLQIQISKNNGFYKIFDLYTFPYRQYNSLYTMGNDYFLDKICSKSTPPVPNAENSIFTQITSFPNPTYNIIWQYAMGYEFQYSVCNLAHPGNGTYPYHYFYRRINGQTSTPTHLEHNYVGWLLTQSYTEPYVPNASYPYTKTEYTSSTYVPTGTLFKQHDLLPEETGQSEIMYYYPTNNDLCSSTAMYAKQISNMVGSTWHNHFDSTAAEKTYKLNLGLVKHIEHKGTNRILDTTLVYYRKTNTCNKLMFATSVEILKKSEVNQFTIYPCPADDEINISAQNSEKYALAIFDMTGRCVSNISATFGDITIPTYNWSSGLYVVKIMSANNKYQQTITIKHASNQ
jgi:hypothetical protein